MKNYTKILKMFVSTEQWRGWMRKPFVINDMAYATDAHIMAITPKINTEVFDSLEEKHELNVLKIIPEGRNKNDVFSIKDIKALIEKAPTERDYDEKENECSECNGSGDVYWEYNGYDKEGDCPECDGIGTTTRRIYNGKRVLSYISMIKIGNSYFKVAILQRIVKAVEALNGSILMLTNQTKSNKESVFKSGDMEFLIMPVYAKSVDEENVIAELKPII